jgi:two-component system invasion response regulator UvrY
MIDSDVSTFMLLQLGVRGVLKKKMRASEIRDAIRTTMETGYYFSNSRLVALLKPVTTQIMMANNIMLTEREIIFLRLACDELTYKEIADEMGLSPRTVENYRDSLFEKLGLKSRTGLVVYAIKNGLAAGFLI